MGEMYRISGGDFLLVFSHMDYMIKTLPRIRYQDLKWGIVCAMLSGCFLYYQKLTAKKLRPGEEYGSAHWGTPEDIRPYVDDDFYNNIIFSQTEFLTMNPKMKVFEHNRNKNVLVYGGSGSGKTYGVVKPNLMQLNATYVLTDPKGYI
ncbi:MAG: type IV secretory system conjugative DNA transfer family protein [Lachnospiraceae bacterium]|nr:type IV secretory system conjugative DNA transfer family protein [Lachnospiraceae bacterium]